MKRIGMIAAVSILMLPLSGQANSLEENIAKGKKLALDGSKGNCLACHLIPGGEMAGNLGPPLLQMKQRYPKRSVLHNQIWDSMAKNPHSMMPPFGKHGVMTKEEVGYVVDYMYSL